MKEMVIEETTQEKILKVILFEIMRNNFLLGNSCEGYDKRKEVRNNLTAQMVKHKESFIFTNKAEQCPSFLLFTTLSIFSKRKCTLQQNRKCNQHTTKNNWQNTYWRTTEYVGCVVLRILEFQGLHELKVFSSTCVRKMRQSTSQSSELFSIQQSYQPNTVVRGHPKERAST